MSIQFVLSLTMSALVQQRIANAYSSTEIQISLDLFDYLNTDFMLIMDDGSAGYLQNPASDMIFPSRKMILTAILSTSQVLDSIARDSEKPEGVNMVIARQESLSWSKFEKVGKLFEYSPHYLLVYC